ncbi:MAG: hypothetical protein VM34scaffold347_20 [Phage 66_12]|jgi:hypothetical protein|nr:MAG: hypothetical protein VM34scaffold347_20 [Phage 66_12]
MRAQHRGPRALPTWEGLLISRLWLYRSDDPLHAVKRSPSAVDDLIDVGITLLVILVLALITALVVLSL